MTAKTRALASLPSFDVEDAPSARPIDDVKAFEKTRRQHFCLLGHTYRMRDPPARSSRSSPSDVTLKEIG